MIGFGLALAGLLAVQILTLQGDIAALRADVAAILERLPWPKPLRQFFRLLTVEPFNHLSIRTLRRFTP